MRGEEERKESERIEGTNDHGKLAVESLSHLDEQLTMTHCTFPLLIPSSVHSLHPPLSSPSFLRYGIVLSQREIADILRSFLETAPDFFFLHTTEAAIAEWRKAAGLMGGITGDHDHENSEETKKETKKEAEKKVKEVKEMKRTHEETGATNDREEVPGKSGNRQINKDQQTYTAEMDTRTAVPLDTGVDTGMDTGMDAVPEPRTESEKARLLLTCSKPEAVGCTHLRQVSLEP